MKKISSVLKGLVFLVLVVAIGATGAVSYFYYTNEDVAREVRQIRLPRPNHFYVGIDVSASIPDDMLDDVKRALVERLQHFVGQKTVTYIVSVFGLPGCGEDSMTGVAAGRSPKDAETFRNKVELPVMAIASVQDGSSGPLTTPLYHFLQKAMKARKGERVIIFSDLVNDDRGCPEQHWFPMKAFEEFGRHGASQILFIYPDLASVQSKTRDAKKAREQKSFIKAVEKLVEDKKVRAFFYPIPYQSAQRRQFLETRLREAVPETVVEVFVDRASNVLGAIVAAVRG